MSLPQGPDLVAGRWELLEPIATGGSSTVWRARDHRTGTICAAKVLRRRDAGELLRFVREQSIRLHHPHVVAPSGWAAEEGTVLIASELVAGGSLATLMGDFGPLSDGTVVTVLDQLLDALEAVHAAGLIHRDVKPANVLLRVTGPDRLDLALVDFGIAIALSDPRLTATGAVVGTPGYVPPEAMGGLEPPSVGHDLYALGRLAVALVLGHEGGESAAALETVQDPTLRGVLASLLAADPADRPDGVGAVRDSLAAAVRDPLPRTRDGEEVVVFDQLAAASTEPLTEPDAEPLTQPEALPGPEPEPVPPPRRRRGVAVVVGGVAVVLALAGWWVGSGRVDPAPTPTSTAAPTSTPTATAEPCTWQEEGDRVAGPAGELVCARSGDGYAWLPSEG